MPTEKMGRGHITLLQILIIFLFFLFVSVGSSVAPNCSVINLYKKDLSLERPFVGSASGHIQDWNWEYSGHTQILGEKGIRLLHSGSLWNYEPVKLENWQVELQFKVHLDVDGDPDSGGRTDEPLLLFWYTGEKKAHREPDEFFEGMRLSFENPLPHKRFDRDHRHPNVVVTINNSTESEAGKVVSESKTSTRGCWSNPSQPQTAKMWLRIRYEVDQLTVTLKRKGFTLDDTIEKWDECFHETWKGVKLPVNNNNDWYYFGISSLIPERIGSIAVLQMRTFELDLQHSMMPACRKAHFHAYAFDDEDDWHGMHRPVVSHSMARPRPDDLRAPTFTVPLLVIGVLTIALVVIGVLSMAWWVERTKSMRLQKLQEHIHASGNKPLVPRSPYSEF